MNWNTVEGNWKQIKGAAREKWGKLTEDELEQAKGKRDAMIGKIQERYGVARDEAEKQLKDFENKPQ